MEGLEVCDSLEQHMSAQGATGKGFGWSGAHQMLLPESSDFLKIQPPKIPTVQLKRLVCLLSPFPHCNKHLGMHILQFTGWFFQS